MSIEEALARDLVAILFVTFLFGGGILWLIVATIAEQWRKARYASFDGGDGKAFAEGALSLADMAALAAGNGEPAQTSGKQERYENLLNQYLLR